MVGGVPEIVGVALGETVIVKDGSEAVTLPSVTLTTMLADVPMFADAGVPLSRPVEVLNVAQLGLPCVLNFS